MKKIKDFTGDGLCFYNAIAISGMSNDDIQKQMNVSSATFYRLYRKNKFDKWEKESASVALNKSVEEIFGPQTPGNNNPISDTKDPLPPERPPKKVPVLPEAVAGTDMEMVYNDTQNDIEYIDVGDLLKDAEAAIPLYGNSMTPNYPSGCIIGVKSNHDGFIQPGEIYAIQTKSNRIVKRLFYNDANDGYTCYSDNTQIFTDGAMKGKFYYPPFDVKFDQIIRIFDVVGVIKRTRNSGIIMRQK